jgi:hypothetical protein
MQSPAQVKTVCDRNGNCHLEGETDQNTLQCDPPLPGNTLAQVKTIVEQYLPGMADANVHYSKTNPDCLGKDHTCPTSLNRTKSRIPNFSERNVITLSKHVKKSIPDTGVTQTHHHFARLTIDGDGNLIKMVVSR